VTVFFYLSIKFQLLFDFEGALSLSVDRSCDDPDDA